MSSYGSGNSPFSRKPSNNTSNNLPPYNSYQNSDCTNKQKQKHHVYNRPPSPPNPFSLFTKTTNPKSLNDEELMNETLQLNYDSQHTATMVMNQLNNQRESLQNAVDNTNEIKHLSIKAKLQLKEMKEKARRRIMRLYMIIGVLGIVDFLAFMRILKCGGSFFCRG